jgi:hypothetical protein
LFNVLHKVVRQRGAIENVQCLTTSIDSPSGAASVVFTSAVVEKAAVATFATVSFFGSLDDEG